MSPQPRHLARLDQVLGADRGKPLLFGELLRPAPDEQDLPGRFQNPPGHPHRVPDRRDRGHRPHPEVLAVHDRTIEHRLAEPVQDRAGAGIERPVVLEQGHGGFHRVESRSAPAQQAEAEADGGEDAGAVGFKFVVRDVPSPAVDHQRGPRRVDDLALDPGRLPIHGRLSHPPGTATGISNPGLMAENHPS